MASSDAGLSDEIVVVVTPDPEAENRPERDEPERNKPERDKSGGADG